MKINTVKQVSYMRLIEAKNDKTDTKTREYGFLRRLSLGGKAKKQKKTEF